MSVIKVTDNKTNLPSTLRITIGRSSALYPLKLSSIIYNKPVV